MLIGELANATGVSARTLRFSEADGLLPEPDRTPSGYRDGGHPPCEHVADLVDRRLEQVDRRLTMLDPADCQTIAIAPGQSPALQRHGGGCRWDEHHPSGRVRCQVPRIDG